MNLIPRRVVRARRDCEVLLTHTAADRLVDGVVVPGRTVEYRQSPGRGWSWLGRMWFWRWIDR